MLSGIVNFPDMTAEERRQKLILPQGKIKVVMDTDTFNEIDDQYAVTCALLEKERMEVLAFHAAPFTNSLSSGPGDGMQKSYEELHRLLDLLGEDRNLAFRGSETYLPDRNTPVKSDAAYNLIKLANECASNGEQLYVLAIGAITNVASALLLDPTLVKKITVIWLGGHPFHWRDVREFNYIQDVPAVQVIFDSGVPFIQIPCRFVAELLNLSRSEIARYCEPCGKIGKFLAQRTYDALGKNNESRVIWDISTVAYCTLDKTFTSEIVPAPRICDDGYYGSSLGRHEMVVVQHIVRDKVFKRFFELLKNCK